MSLIAPAPSPPGLACAGCGWEESPGATSCRSCGTPMPGRAGSYAPAPAPAPLQPEEFPLPRADPVPGRRSRPLLPVAPAPRWSGISFLSLLLHRHSLAVLSLIGAWCYFSGGGPISHPPGVLIAEEPVQGPVPAGRGFWQSEGTNFRALASYSIKSRVLHTERYRWDAMSDIAPLDLGVGWGVMSDETHATRCDFTNAGRYLNWTWSGEDFPEQAASRSMVNMHMLPANDRVRDHLLNLRRGQLFHARGYLVEVTRPGMGPWTSSLSRLDTGDGACEIMWVESLSLLP